MLAPANPPRFNGALPGLPDFGPLAPAAEPLAALVWRLERSQWWNQAAHRARQLEQLGRILPHAATTVPFYAEHWAQAGWRAGDPLTWDAFRSLPLLPREAVHRAGERLHSAKPPAQHGAIGQVRTSGSSGMPIRALTTGATRLMWLALTARSHLWHGLDPSLSLAALRPEHARDSLGRDVANWGPPMALLFRTGPASVINSRQPIDRQWAWLAARNPAYLITLPSNLEGLIAEGESRGTRLSSLRAVCCYGETLRPEVRDLCARTWKIPLIDMYSAQEVGYMGLQCPDHGGYHVPAESVILEVLDDDGRPTVPGTAGRAVVTVLGNFAMPLIRYVIGDYILAADGPCPCGRGLPRFTRVQGRQRNLLTLPDGRRLWPSFPEETWGDLAPIRQIQLVQRSREEILIRLCMDRPLESSEREALGQAFAAGLGHPFRFVFEVQADPIRGENGKYEDFVSLI